MNNQKVLRSGIVGFTQVGINRFVISKIVYIRKYLAFFRFQRTSMNETQSTQKIYTLLSLNPDVHDPI